jgi:hypothetical protein
MAMNMSKKLALILAATAVALPQTAMAKSAPLSKSWAATWQLNSDKSKFSSPDTTVKAETRSYAIAGNRVTMRSTMTNSAGKRIKWSYSAVTNGRWYPMVGNPNADRIALIRVSDRELKSKSTLHGKPSATATAAVSGDGKELTIHRSILTAKGGPSDDTLVYDRAK